MGTRPLAYPVFDQELAPIFCEGSHSCEENKVLAWAVFSSCVAVVIVVVLGCLDGLSL